MPATAIVTQHVNAHRRVTARILDYAAIAHGAVQARRGGTVNAEMHFSVCNTPCLAARSNPGEPDCRLEPARRLDATPMAG